VAVEPLTRERRRELTRAHLLAAAAEVFARRGYHGATLEEVAATAGFTTGAIYSNFAGKEDLMLAVAEARDRALIAAFSAASSAPDLSPAELIDSIRSVYAGTSLEQREQSWQLWTEFTLQLMRDPESRDKLVAQQRAGLELIVDLVRRHTEDRRNDLPIPVELIARIYVAVFTGLWQQQVLDPDSIDDDAFPLAVAFISRAVDELRA
jgi:AcrR family transcriptional regulator